MTSPPSVTATQASVAAKPHYPVLDGLRGVACVMVVFFHLFEAYSVGIPQNQIINHGYLAVDFFFLLSGFVVAYAYDDRRANGMSIGAFFKRRLVRLQPMIIVGSVLGAVLFAFQKASIFPAIETATLWQVILVMIIGFTMIPLPPSGDIRGWNETFPLNGPAWSLFYEYVANIIYAVGLRKLSNKVLACLVAVAGLALLHYAVTGPRGDLVGGWSLDPEGIRIGLTRVLFPFLAGVLLMRSGIRLKVPYGFAVSGLLLVIVLSLPRFGGTDHLWLNGLYEAVCVILVFPLIVAVGAGEMNAKGPTLKVARVFGDLSYPLYITHYPLIYIYTGWVIDQKVPPAQGALVGIAVFTATVAIAWICLKIFDEPARRWLTSKFLR